MDKGIITFGNIQIEKQKFHCYKNSVFLKYVNIENIFISSNIFPVEKNYKHFIGYIDDFYKTKSLDIMFPKTSTYAKHYDGKTKSMYFLIGEDELLKTYNGIN